MENRELRQEVPRDPVGQILPYEGRSIALVDLGRAASEALRVSWLTARPFHSGGVVESAWMVPMLGAGGTAASSLLAGNVFLATANPATLMTMGLGEQWNRNYGRRLDLGPPEVSPFPLCHLLPLSS